jgi:pimeloyl-ACP methyl ester carboxylesterase
VRLWHGAQDRVMPAAAARRLAAMIPQCRSIFYPDEGHLSPLANRAREVLGALAGVRAGASLHTKP